MDFHSHQSLKLKILYDLTKRRLSSNRMNRRVDDLRYQLNALHEELRAYEGIGENLGNLKRRLQDALEENKNLKKEKEIRLLEETMKDVFLERAAEIEKLAQENAKMKLQLEECLEKNPEEAYRKLKADNDFLRARVIEQDLHIQHLRDRLGQVNDKRPKAKGDGD